MSILKIAAIDPALRHTGFATASYNTETGKIFDVKVSMLFTKKGNHKQEIMNCYHLADKFRSLGMVYPYICVEVPGGSQSASAAKGIGCVLALFTQIPSVRLVPVTPIQAKKAALGNPKATKREMIEWATQLHPHAGWKQVKWRGSLRYTDDNEHMADAIAVMYAGVANGLKTIKECV